MARAAAHVVHRRCRRIADRAAGFAAYRVTPKGIPPTFDLAPARAMVDGGNCEQAVVEHIDPALIANPDDADALELRRRCIALTRAARRPPEPGPRPSAARADRTPELDQVETLIAANGCAEAVQHVNAVLAGDPNNERAKELAARAAACGAAPPAPAPPVHGPALWPSRSHRPRAGSTCCPGNSRRIIRSASWRCGNGTMMPFHAPGTGASAGCQSVRGDRARGADRLPRVGAATCRRARGHQAAGGQGARPGTGCGEGGRIRGRYRCVSPCERSRPGVRVDGPLQRIAEQKIGRGRKRCDEAKVAFSYGENAAAAAAFQDVLTLLPPSDPCHTLAGDRLKQLGK